MGPIREMAFGWKARISTSMRYRMITLMLGLMAAGLTPVAAESYKDVKISPQTEVKMHFYDV